VPKERNNNDSRNDVPKDKHDENDEFICSPSLIIIPIVNIKYQDMFERGGGG